MVNNCMDKCISWLVMVLFPSPKVVIELEVHFLSWTRREGVRCFSGEGPRHPSVTWRVSRGRERPKMSVDEPSHPREQGDLPK